VTVFEFYRDTFEPVRLLGRTANTRIQYQVAVRHWARFTNGQQLGDIDDALLARFLAEFSKSHAAPTTNKTRAHLLTILRFAVKRGLLREVPDVPTLPEPEEAPVAWLREEVERMLKAAACETGDVDGIPAAPWWVSLFRGIYDSGGRIGAVLTVAPAALSLQDATMVLPGWGQKTHRWQICGLSPATVQAIKVIWDDSRERVWPWPYCRETLYPHLARICKRAGVPHGGNSGMFHRLRKTHGSYVQANGGDAQRSLGHSTPAVTQRYLDPRIVGRQDASRFLPPLDLSD